MNFALILLLVVWTNGVFSSTQDKLPQRTTELFQNSNIQMGSGFDQMESRTLTIGNYDKLVVNNLGFIFTSPVSGTLPLIQVPSNATNATYAYTQYTSDMPVDETRSEMYNILGYINEKATNGSVPLVRTVSTKSLGAGSYKYFEYGTSTSNLYTSQPYIRRFDGIIRYILPLPPSHPRISVSKGRNHFSFSKY